MRPRKKTVDDALEEKTVYVDLEKPVELKLPV